MEHVFCNARREVLHVAKFLVRFVGQGDTTVEADDWKLDSGWVVFLRTPSQIGDSTPAQHRVWGARVETVKSIALKEE